MAVVNAVQTKKSVADPCAVYESMRPLWEKSRAVIGGERFAKDFDGALDVTNFTNLLIPFSPSMTPQQYAFYKAEAELPGIVAQYARVLIGGLLRKQPQLKLPDGVPDGAYDWIMTQFSQSGAPLVSFLDEALWEELKTSRTWIYVDFPKMENADKMSKSEMQEVRPYPVLWNAESIVNWRYDTDSVSGEKHLQQVIVRGYEESYADNEFHPSFIDTVRVHEIVEGFYQIRVFQKKDEAASIPVVNGKLIQQYAQTASGSDLKLSAYEMIELNDGIMANGERLTRIPAWPFNGSQIVMEPMLMPIIDREVALYNKVSRRNHLLYGAATYTPVISSNMTDEDFDSIVAKGLGSWLKLNQGDTASVLDTPTSALSDMDRAITAAIEEMAKLGIRMLSPESSQSGVALDIRNAGQTAQLGTLNTKIGNQMASIIAFMLNWRYDLEIKSTEIGFELSSDFKGGALGADWLRLATEWYEKGLIPRSVWLGTLKQNDVLVPDYDDSKGKAEIDEDDFIFTPKENTEYSMQQAEEQKALAASQAEEQRVAQEEADAFQREQLAIQQQQAAQQAEQQRADQLAMQQAGVQ